MVRSSRSSWIQTLPHDALYILKSSKDYLCITTVNHVSLCADRYDSNAKYDIYERSILSKRRTIRRMYTERKSIKWSLCFKAAARPDNRKLVLEGYVIINHKKLFWAHVEYYYFGSRYQLAKAFWIIFTKVFHTSQQLYLIVCAAANFDGNNKHILLLSSNCLIFDVIFQ